MVISKWTAVSNNIKGFKIEDLMDENWQNTSF